MIDTVVAVVAPLTFGATIALGVYVTRHERRLRRLEASTRPNIVDRTPLTRGELTPTVGKRDRVAAASLAAAVNQWLRDGRPCRLCGQTMDACARFRGGCCPDHVHSFPILDTGDRLNLTAAASAATCSSCGHTKDDHDPDLGCWSCGCMSFVTRVRA